MENQDVKPETTTEPTQDQQPQSQPQPQTNSGMDKSEIVKIIGDALSTFKSDLLKEIQVNNQAKPEPKPKERSL